MRSNRPGTIGRWCRALVALWLLALSAPAAAAPITCSLGAYITSIHDIDTVHGTFAAEAWVWSRCPGNTEHALATQEFTNADNASTSLQVIEPRPGGDWEQRKLTGVFRHDFALRLFPFDRHQLVIGLEEGVQDASGLRYVFDAANSGISPAIRPDGWRVTGFSGRAGTALYSTNFGDPSLPPGSPARYAHLDLTVDLARHDLSSFFKLTVPVYVAAMLALLSLLMFAEEGRNVINPRIALLAGLLFAVVVNLRGIDDVIGSTPALTLMDVIHFVALLLVLAATVAAVRASSLIERDIDMTELRRRDRRLFRWAGGLYLATNLALVGAALLWR